MSESLLDGTIKIDPGETAAQLTNVIGLLNGIAEKTAKVEEEARKTREASEKMFSIEAIRGAFELFAHGVETLKRMGETLTEGAIDAERHERAVTRLGAAYEMVRESTNDTVTAEQALQVQQRLLEAGIHTTGEELATITRRAREHATAMGTDLPQALDSLTGALETGATRALHRFGLAAHHGEGRAHGLHRMLRTLHTQQEHAAVSARTLAESTDVSARSYTELKNNIMAGVAEFINLRGIMESIVSITDGSGWQNLTDSFRELFGFSTSRENANAGLRQIGHAMGLSDAQVNAAMSRGGATPAQIAAARRERGLSTASTAPATPRDLPSEEEISQGAAVAEARRQLRIARAEAVDAGVVVETLQHRGVELADAWMGRQTEATRAAVEHSHKMQDLARQFAQLGIEAPAAIARIGRTQQEWGAAVEAQQQRAIDQQQRLLTLMGQAGDALHTRAQFGRSRGNIGTAAPGQMMGQGNYIIGGETGPEDMGPGFSLDQGGSMGGAGPSAATQAMNEGNLNEFGGESHDADTGGSTFRYSRQQRQLTSMSGQVSQVFLANNAAIAESSTTTASIVGDAWGSMTGALKSHMAAMIEGKETVGQALEGILKETLMSIATESAVKSLFSFASAIAAAAVEDYPGAAKFAAAGVEYAAVAALAGGGAYAMYSAGSHSSASAGGGAAAMPASAGGVGGPSSGGGGGTTIVVNLAGVAVTNQGAQDAIMRGVQHLQMRGLIRAA